MTIRLATESDQHKWDQYVNAHPDAAHVHLWPWKKVIEDSYNKKSYYLIAESENKIRGLLPLVYIKSRLFGKELVSMPYATYGGVLADTAQIQEELIHFALNLANQINAETIKLRQVQKISAFNFENTKIFRDDSKVSMRLGLNRDSEQQFNGFKAKLRSQIRRPQKEGMTFKLGSAELIDDFYNVFTVNMRDLGSPVHSKKLFINLAKQFPQTVKVGVVYFKSLPVATGIITIMGEMVEIPWASSLRRYNRFGPNMLLYWSFLEYCCNSAIKYFDFGRSTPGEGTYKFKQQWGTEPSELNWITIDKNLKMKESNFENNNKKLFVSVWSKIPVSITKFVGPILRKQISL